MASQYFDSDRPEIADYRILRVIGHGGMSTVYLAEQVSLGRKVALKVMLPEALADEVSRGRFENEARTIARLQHPHIVGIHEVGRTSDGVPFYSMPYLPRGHLAQRELRGDQQRVAGILRALLNALDFAHVRGVVHRDVKAENVLFDEAERPLLADFGIALRRGSNPRLTSAGLAVGSTAYMPPEQARGIEVDRRADIYSLGVLGWEMLTGRLPYTAGDALSMALKHVQDPIPRLPAVLKHWQGFFDSALAKQAGDRFASAQDMLEALGQVEKRAGRNFGVLEVPLQVEAAAAPPAHGPAWKYAVAAALVGLLGFGIVRSFGDGDRSLPAAGAVDAGGGIDDLPTPMDGAATGVLDGIGNGNPNEGAAYVANANQQLEAGHLLAPANANAWDSWDAAWRINPTHADVQMLTARLFDALSAASLAAMRNGDAAGARVAFERAKQLDARRGGSGSAIALLRRQLDAALGASIDALAAKQDGRGAEAVLASTGWLNLDPARRQALQARVARLPGAPASVTGTAAASTSTASAGILTVSRTDYARFARATSRPPADCGRRNGFFGPRRDWTKLGSDGAPVVCVSAHDAEAYAIWLGAREKRRYRLPSPSELKANAATPVSGWTTLCADSACRRRNASGKARALDAGKGYADVGIRLVRDR